MARFVTLKNYGFDVNGNAQETHYRISLPFLNCFLPHEPARLLTSRGALERKLVRELRYFGMKNEYSNAAKGAFSFDVDGFTLLNHALRSAGLLKGSLEYVPGGGYGARATEFKTVPQEFPFESLQAGDSLELGYQKTGEHTDERWYAGKVEKVDEATLLLRTLCGWRCFTQEKISWLGVPARQPALAEFIHRVELQATLQRRGGYFPRLRLEVLDFV